MNCRHSCTYAEFEKINKNKEVDPRDDLKSFFKNLKNLHKKTYWELSKEQREITDEMWDDWEKENGKKCTFYCITH